MTKLLPEFKQDLAGYELVPSDGGRFELSLDGKQIYSKLETGSFPDEEEIVAAIRRRVAS